MRWGWLVGILMICLAGCDGGVQLPWSPTPTPAHTPTATATVTPTATRTPTVTVTPTVTSTATPTATPSPTSTPSPAKLALRVDPPVVGQGRTLAVVLSSNRPLTVDGTLGETPLQFYPAESAYWALLGIPLNAPVGRRILRLTATDSLNRVQALTATIEISATYQPLFNFTLPADKHELVLPEVVQPEQEELNAVWGFTTPLWRGQTMGFPLVNVPAISAGFGQFRIYDGGILRDYHTGVDYPMPSGTIVRAPAVGRVAVAEPLRVRGNAVWLDHGWGVYSGYFHFSTIAVQVGQLVQPGQVLGTVGTTGRSTGPHLHWEMRVGGVAVDPIEWTRRAIGPVGREAGP